LITLFRLIIKILSVPTSAPISCSFQPFLSLGMSLLFIETLPLFRRLGDRSHGVISQTPPFMMLYYSGSLSVNRIIQILMSHMQHLHYTSLLLPLTLQLRFRLNFCWERSKLRVWMYDQCLWKQDIKDFHLSDQPVNIS
jgi:hypothetical protein